MCPHSNKKMVDSWYWPSKWTWTPKNREHWPYSPITKRRIWLTQTLTSVHPDPFQALLTKQHTSKKPTNTKRLQWFRMETVRAHPPCLWGATAHLRFLVWRFKRLAFGPGRVFPRSQDHWPMVPYGPISDKKWSRPHIYKKVMVSQVVRNGPNSYLDVNTYPLIYQPGQSTTVDVDSW